MQYVVDIKVCGRLLGSVYPADIIKYGDCQLTMLDENNEAFGYFEVLPGELDTWRDEVNGLKHYEIDYCFPEAHDED